MEITKKKRIQTKEKKENSTKFNKKKKKKEKKKKTTKLGLATSLAKNLDKASTYKAELVAKHDLAQTSARDYN